MSNLIGAFIRLRKTERKIMFSTIPIVKRFVKG